MSNIKFMAQPEAVLLFKRIPNQLEVLVGYLTFDKVCFYGELFYSENYFFFFMENPFILKVIRSLNKL